MNELNFTRRNFLRVSTSAVGGLMLGFHIPTSVASQASRAAEASEEDAQVIAVTCASPSELEVTYAQTRGDRVVGTLEHLDPRVFLEVEDVILDPLGYQRRPILGHVGASLEDLRG